MERKELRGNDHRKLMLADLLSEMIEDPTMRADEISDAIMDELLNIRSYHTRQSEKVTLLISYLGGV